MSKRVLGRGLDALIPKSPVAAETDEVNQIRWIPLDRIAPNPRQPRERFDATRLEELARSIREKGIIEPLIVRPLRDGRFELIAGERRLRAAQLIDQKTVPVILRDSKERETLEIALIENLQREDLNPIEEARAYLRLTEEFGRTHAEISQEVGKDRSTITNLLRLLRLPDEVLEEVSRGTLSVGHARVLLSVESPDAQVALARKMIVESWNVRQAERFVAMHGQQRRQPPQPHRKSQERDQAVVRVEEALRYALGTEVHLEHGPRGGRIEIRYETQEELERILELLGIQIH